MCSGALEEECIDFRPEVPIIETETEDITHVESTSGLESAAEHQQERVLNPDPSGPSRNVIDVKIIIVGDNADDVTNWNDDGVLFENNESGFDASFHYIEESSILTHF